METFNPLYIDVRAEQLTVGACVVVIRSVDGVHLESSSASIGGIEAVRGAGQTVSSSLTSLQRSRGVETALIVVQALSNILVIRS
jgi:hypothetical protein